MKIDKKAASILDMAQAGRAPTKEECVFLLQFPETSLEAALLRAVSDSITRRRFNNEGVVLAQIGIEIARCPGGCKFCSFGEGHTAFEPSIMNNEDILRSADNFTASGDLYALFLMTMHTFDFERLVHIVRIVRERIPRETEIVVNIGDFDRAQAQDLKATGVNGAYHVCRLREGIDTALDPEKRKATMRIIKDSRIGLLLLLRTDWTGAQPAGTGRPDLHRARIRMCPARRNEACVFSVGPLVTTWPNFRAPTRASDGRGSSGIPGLPRDEMHRGP